MAKDARYDGLLGIIEQDRQELVELCLKLGNIPSPHGQERRVGQAVMDWLNQNGIQAALQLITPESVNVVGVLPGSGDGASLIYNAHLDTGAELRPDAAEAEKKIQTAWVDGELIFGKGVINDKAQLCAFMIAARAIRRAGLQLRGDLTVTGVAFETGGPSVDEFQGVNFPGEGFGAKWLIDRGVTADYALVGETSSFGVVTAECGAAYLKIRVHGREIYTPRLQRGASLREHPNVFLKAAHVVLALEKWAIGYEEREKQTFLGGTFVPKAQVLEMRGDGGVAEPSARCDIYLDVRLVPGKSPRAVKKEIEQALRGTGIDGEVTVFQYSRGYIAQNAEPLIAAVEDSHRQVFGSSTPAPSSAEVSMWRDLNAFNEAGIPSICYGPPRQRETFSGAQNRAMKIDDLVAATKVYALTAVRVCGDANA
jgi:acetylornithine deacetylase/succinyl-diaminopimelate desuccinylase-like protein